MIDTVRVSVPNGVLKEFRRRALASEDEVLGVLVGRLEGARVVVEGVVFPPCRATPSIVWPPTQGELRRIAREAGKSVVGTLHSHPNAEYKGPSEADLQVLGGIGRVFGVYDISPRVNGRRRTSLKWWVGSPGVRVRVV